MDSQLNAPPCVELGKPLNWCARQKTAVDLYGRFSLGGAWTGWRICGAELVSPDGKRMNSEKLRGVFLKAGAVNRGRPKSKAAAVCQLSLFDD